MFNVVSGAPGDAQAVLIRAAEPIRWDADLSGPGKLTRAMRITRADNGVDLSGDKLYFLRGEMKRPNIKLTKRIGVDYAGKWKDELLRMIDADSPAVSRGG